MTETKSYKNTVNLPNTKFEMRANAVKREPEIQKFWAENKIYERLSQHNPGEAFVLHDGPPYANGALHIGHALNKILKDIINRYQILQGRKVRYVPGWDCHGLPIELKVLQQMSPEERQNLPILELRQRAWDFALNTVQQQSTDFQRYGIWGNWEHPYLTLTPEYEAAQIAVFGKMVLKGYIYRGLKPVHWSPSSKTALAEAELEYPEGHTSRSIYAAFTITHLSEVLKTKLGFYLPNLEVAIWTTTPWTIPANLAVSVNPELNYAVVQCDYKTKYLLVAADLVERLATTLNMKLTVLATVLGKDLEHTTYKHPLYDRESPIVIGGDYVTTESGTGLVHTAPGHGQEDYLVGQRYNLPILSPVDGNGNFTAEAGQFAGLNVLGEGNGAVVDALQEAGALLKEEPYQHKYPYDWRTKKPTIYRATEQWFASVEGFREAALQAIASVNWIPAQGENRITAMVSERSDWCISRQRSWGVPIPVFYDIETGEPLLNEETINHVQEIIAAKGSDAWWELSEAELLPASYLNNGRTYRKGTDTMDVWFDSGSSWAAVAQQNPELKYPVDLYLEGSDQHRGWFQSSLLTSVATNGIAPYKTVLTHGFVLDEKGHKMSKSLGNVVDPAIVIEGGKNQQQQPAYGADVLRLWVSSVDYSSDVPLSDNILKQLADIKGKIRNTSRFLLGNLHDFDPEQDAVAYEQLPEIDRYMLHRMTEVFTEITAAFESYQFFRFFQTVQNFCVVDLSNFYLDTAKDRLYISAANSLRRRSCQTILAIALENLARAIAPVLCHTAEDIWQFLPYPSSYKSIFESGWVQLDEQWENPELAVKWQKIREIRGEVNKVMEQARTEKMIGASLEAKVLLYVSDESLRQELQAFNPQTTIVKPIVVSTPITNVQQETTAINIEPVSSPSVVTDEPQVTAAKVTAETPASEPVQTEETANKWQQLFKEVLQPFYKSPAYLRYVLTEYKGLALLTLIIAIATLPLNLVSVVLKAVHEVPLLANFFEVVGLFVVGRYLLAPNVQEAIVKELRSIPEKLRIKKSAPVESVAVIEEISPINTQEIEPSASVIEQTPIIDSEEIQQISIVDSEEIEQISIASFELSDTNGVDELRYLFLASQVELLTSTESLAGLTYKLESDDLSIGVVKAEGEKCDRCWNYSTYVGQSKEDPLLCERCIPALAGEF